MTVNYNFYKREFMIMMNKYKFIKRGNNNINKKYRKQNML